MTKTRDRMTIDTGNVQPGDEIQGMEEHGCVVSIKVRRTSVVPYKRAHMEFQNGREWQPTLGQKVIVRRF